MLVEIHMIQNHAPSNLNRDDTGSPKEALFGGALRARISSQCLKRSIRRSPIFEKALEGHLATRTRGLPALLRQELLSLGCTEDEAAAIGRKVTALGSGKEGEKEMTRQLIFLSNDEIKRIAASLKALVVKEGMAGFSALKIEEIEKGLGSSRPRSVDVALFGRMTTTTAFEDVAASIQVAHAISTGKVEKQFDYFTAVDDLVEASDENGAGMIGDVEFNSATYYKYFSLDWDGFVANLGGDTETAERALGAFLRAAALTTPSGKQNTFAAHNAPDAILIEVKREKLPLSYANAFLKPIRAQGGQDVVELSIKAMSDYASQLKIAYGLETLKSLYLSVRGEKIEGARKVATLVDLIEETRLTVAEAVKVVAVQ